MKSSSMTLTLVILVILASLWSSGRLSRLVNIVFGK